MHRSPPRALRALGTCLLALAAAFAPWACGGDPPPPARPTATGYDADGRSLGPLPAVGRRPNLVLVLVDTLRADALSVAEPERGVMPGLAAWARGGIAFEHAIAPSPWTLPSVVSLLTGLLPSEHRQAGGRMPPPDPAPLTALTEVLARSFGYETVAFAGLPPGEAPQQMFLGFSRLEADFQLQGAAPRLEGWARGRRREQPFVLVLHTYEAHDPYGAQNHPHPPRRGPAAPPFDLDVLGDHPEPAELALRLLTDHAFRHAVRRPGVADRLMPEIVGYFFDGLARDQHPSLGTELHGMYREGVTWVDGLLATTLERLQGLGLLEGTLVAVTSDHGEAFGEHGALQHQRWLYDELLRVPLVLRGPPPFDQPKVVRGQVALHDLLPTFFDWAGFPLPEALEGRSFLPLLEKDGPGRPVLAEEARTTAVTGARSHALLVAARTLEWKYVITHETLPGNEGVREELFDLRADPGERANLLGGAAPAPAVPKAFADAVEAAKDRLYDPGLRLLPEPPPRAPRPPRMPSK
jgi:arylsulfatase A-like enzyme